jgi:NAD(P)H-hydrate epimerase
MTPHAGELGRLLHGKRDDMLADPIRHARDAASRFKQTVILKTGYSVAATTGEPTRLSPRAAPELATAGTGDVLAGLVGGLLAQGLSPHAAATVALYVGSRAGQAARARRGVYGVMARDVIDEIPRVMRGLIEPVWSSEEWDVSREEL